MAKKVFLWFCFTLGMVVADIAFQFFFDSSVVIREIVVGIIPNAIIAAIFIYVYDLAIVKKGNKAKNEESK